MTTPALPPLAERLIPVRQRLARAREISGELKSLEKSYLDHSTGFRIEQADDRYTVRVRMDRQPPARAALIMGEFIHQCRSALDNLVVTLADEGAQRVLSDDESATHQFPIEYDLADLEKTVPRRLMHVPDVYVDRIREVQPFAGLPDAPGIAISEHPLARLNAMSNKDKHRRLAVLVQAPADVAIGSDRGVTPVFRTPPFQDGDVIATVPAGGFTEAHVWFELGYEVPEIRKGKAQHAPAQKLAFAPLAETLLRLLETNVVAYIVGNGFEWRLDRDQASILD